MPHSESEEFARFLALIAAHLKEDSASSREHLGILALGVLIDAGAAKILTDGAVRDMGDGA